MASEKRTFTVAGSDHGVTGGNYVSTSPTAAAKKAARVLAKKTHLEKFKFILREKTKGSEKKSYFYEAMVENLKEPIVIEAWTKKDGTPVTITKKIHLRVCHHSEMHTVKTPSQ